MLPAFWSSINKAGQFFFWGGVGGGICSGLTLCDYNAKERSVARTETEEF